MQKKISFCCPHCGNFKFEELKELCCDECGEIIEKDINGKKAVYNSKLFCPEFGVNSFATFTCPKCHYPLCQIIQDENSLGNKQ